MVDVLTGKDFDGENEMYSKCNLRKRISVIVKEKLCIHPICPPYGSLFSNAYCYSGIVEKKSSPLSVFCTWKDDKQHRNYKKV